MSDLTELRELSTPLNAVAFSLGWRFVEIYIQDSYEFKAEGHSPNAPPEYLPGTGEMSQGKQAITLLHQVERDCTTLKVSNDDKGFKNTILNNIENNAPDSTNTIRLGILNLYEYVRKQLDDHEPPDRAAAFELGRELAYITLRPAAGDIESFTVGFDPQRLQSAYDLLERLTESLPPQSAQAVRKSLSQWATWIESPSFDSRRQRRANEHDGTFAVNIETTEALRRQGELWRRLLSGEQIPVNLLKADDYVQAGLRMIGRIRAMAARFLRDSWLPCLAFAVLLCGIGYLIFQFAATSTAFAVIVSTFAAVGVTWKGIGATLGKALDEAQRPLWEAEIVVGLAIAATQLPYGMKALARNISGTPYRETSP